MEEDRCGSALEAWRKRSPRKFRPLEEVFGGIHRGAHLFIGTGCGEPQALIDAMGRYLEAHPKAFFDAEVLHVWTLGVAPYAEERFKANFRLNSFFIGQSTRRAVNEGAADYTPAFLSAVPGLIREGRVPVDVALVQVSPPDRYGFMSLGISVDIVKAAVEKAKTVIAQVNARMPRVHGDGFLHMDEVDFLFPHDEALLEYGEDRDTETARRIGEYVARLVRDGDTIQVGYGSIPDGVLANLSEKRHLGVHTELLSDGVVRLIRQGVVDNSRKTLDRGKTIATFCMGKRETYDYLHDNPAVHFKTIDYTNDPMIIASQERMTAINSALEVDLTGAATAESLGKTLYSGIGGQADFMRGAILARGGKTILALPATAEEGKVSRIVPYLAKGASVTLVRGDTHYVVTEFGIAYLHGKSLRERAMELIAIAHPGFRPGLYEEAKRLKLIYKDQAYIVGEGGEYPADLETYRTTQKGLEVFLRPVKPSDEDLLRDFFHALTDQDLYRRFLSVRKDMPHQRLQDFTVIDYTREMVILAFLPGADPPELVGLGQYGVIESIHMAEVAFAVRPDAQGKGVASEMLAYLGFLAKGEGLLGFTAEVLPENKPMLRVFEKAGFQLERNLEGETYELTMRFH